MVPKAVRKESQVVLRAFRVVKLKKALCYMNGNCNVKVCCGFFFVLTNY